MKKRYIRRLINLLLFSFGLFVIFTSVYFYISAKTKYGAINASIGIIRDAISTGIRNSITSNLTGIYGLFIAQIIIFIAASFSLLFGIWYIVRLYLVEKKNALIDSLTGIYNKRAVFFGLEREIARARRHNHNLSIAVIDIDFFKKYNDFNGHVAGDRLLQRFAKILESRVRDSDLYGRIGGEEFLIVFPETSLQDSAKICERIRKSVEKSYFPGETKMPNGKVTVSIGLAIFGKGAISKREIMIEKADENLYRAKHLGRNVVVYK